MQTVVIFDNVGIDHLKFFVFEGDLGRLDGVYINASDGRDDLQQELSGIILKNGSIIPGVEKKEAVAAIRAGADMIVCGFLP